MCPERLENAKCHGRQMAEADTATSVVNNLGINEIWQRNGLHSPPIGTCLLSVHSF